MTDFHVTQLNRQLIEIQLRFMQISKKEFDNFDAVLESRLSEKEFFNRLELFASERVELGEVFRITLQQLQSLSTSSAIEAEQMAQFWLFKAPPNKRARIHRASCSSCNNGKGQEGQLKKEGGPTSWTSFSTLAEAEKAMSDLQYTDAKRCGTCLPVDTHR